MSGKLILKYKNNIGVWSLRLFGVFVVVMTLTVFKNHISLPQKNTVLTIIIYVALSFWLIGLSSLFKNEMIHSVVIFFSTIVILATYVFSKEHIPLIFLFYFIPGLVPLLSASLKQQKLHKLEKDLNEIQTRYNITTHMMKLTSHAVDTDDLDVILQKILEQTVHLLPAAQYGSILIRHNDILKFHAAFGYDLEKLKDIELPVKESFQFKMSIGDEPKVINNVKTFSKKNLFFVYLF